MAITRLTGSAQDDQFSSEDKILIDRFLEQTNIVNAIADIWGENELVEMGRAVVEGYTLDEQSREDWLKRSDEYLKLATQVAEAKNHPWPNAANIKYPLLTEASLEFSARAYPALVQEPNPVKAKVNGEKTEEKNDSARRVSLHMSWQILEEMSEWEEDMDKLCLILPIIGCAFKKTYHSARLRRNVSELVLPKDLVVDYFAKDLKTAGRITHRLEFKPNQVKERMNRGTFREVDLTRPKAPDEKYRKVQDQSQGTTPPVQDKYDTIPYTFLEQHTWWDLDDDGYKEPYIITVELDSKQVVRVVANYHQDTVERAPNGDIIAITPVSYFTKYGFIPNPDGGFYDLGFGLLLGPLNRVANTVINQLLDSGTLNNLPSGFVARGVRFKGGRKSVHPGEWKATLSTGDDLRKGIVPLPVKEPSTVLFQLLGTILEGGQRISSVSDIMSGVNPGQNQPLGTSMAVLEQGLKVFSSIHKRMFRAEKDEFRKLYDLNRRYVKEKQYFEVLDAKPNDPDRVFAEDYSNHNFNITPTADPKVNTEAQRMLRAQWLVQLREQGMPLNTEAVTKRVLAAMEEPDVEELMKPDPNAQPDPKVVLGFQQLAWDKEKFHMEQAAKEKMDMATATKNLAQGELFLSQSEAQAVKRNIDQLNMQLQHLMTWLQVSQVGQLPQGQPQGQQKQPPMQGRAAQGEQPGQGGPSNSEAQGTASK